MSLGLNVNSSNNAQYLRNFSASGQNISFGSQTQGALQKDTVQFTANAQDTGEKPSNMRKILFGAALVALGSIATVIAFKVKGTSSESAKKAVTKAADAVSEAAEGAEGAKKTSLFETIKTKIKAVVEDAKASYETHEPVPEAAPVRAAAPVSSNPSAPAAVNAKVTGILSSIGDTVAPVEKFQENAQSFIGKGQSAVNNAVGAVSGDAQTRDWASRIMSDLAIEDELPTVRAGFRKSNVFNRINNDSWVYNEGCSESLIRKTKHIERGIIVDHDNITVALDRAKTQNGVETAKQLYKANTSTGEITLYSDYRAASGTLQFKKTICLANGTEPKVYVEGYRKLSDGTEQIARKAEYAGGYVTDREGVIVRGGTESCVKTATYDATSGTVSHYGEGCKTTADGVVEYSKEFSAAFGEYSYSEGVKLLPDGTETALKKTQLSPDDNSILSYSENFKRTAAGEITADKRIEYGADGTPKFYYEGYRETASGDITFSYKAKLIDRGWVKSR